MIIQVGAGNITGTNVRVVQLVLMSESGEMVCQYTVSPAEARNLGEQLVRAADTAEGCVILAPADATLPPPPGGRA